MKSDRESEVWLGVLAGGLAGIAGATAMVLFNRLLAETGFGSNDLGAHKQHRHVRGKPNETDGTIADDPASEKAAAKLVEAAVGAELGDTGEKVAGSVAHHAFGALAGALYGTAVATAPQLAIGRGAPYGALVWITAAEFALPLAGLSKRPWHYPAERHVASFATHIVFGLTLEGVRRWITRAIR
jgi:hypothetical protein